tara:strand:- start:95 stop:649 length:555 start_codon:yes stop_codon:yes gene_type:complete
MNKWLAISLGTAVGLGHIGMIGLLANRNQFPQLNLPIGEYTSYSVRAGKDGYAINYRANDPLIMGVRKTVERPAGFLGFGKAKTSFEEQYTMDGAKHLQDRPTGKISAAKAKCIKAAGGGEQTGRIVGGSVGAAVGTSGLASIPYVGWVLSGAATLLGMEQGAEIGGQMAMDFAGCEDIDETNS